ncbi:MAG: glucose-1-phosphate adenylyltransferase [Bacillota bacterium]
MLQKEMIAMLLAGGQGSRLGGLTKSIAKPAVAFGGKYRIIDFSLSNCTNSKIDTVGVLTQYKPLLLNSYIGTGVAWDLDYPYGGVHILPPFTVEDGGNWYKGTANAIYHNLDFINRYEPEYVLIISGDHIYKMDYRKMLNYHKEKRADLTISTIQVPWEEASRFGIISADREGAITKFAEKPKKPESNLASMGIYIFSWPVLKKALQEDSKNHDSEHDFGKNVIPMLHKQNKRVFAYEFSGYWKDVGTIESYYEANMDLLNEKPQLDLFDAAARVYSNSPILAPQYLGSKAMVKRSLISNGCTVLGRVEHSVLGPGVLVEEGAIVVDSIVLPNAVINKDSVIKQAIVAEGVRTGVASMVNAEDEAEGIRKRIQLVEQEQLAFDFNFLGGAGA